MKGITIRIIGVSLVSLFFPLCFLTAPQAKEPYKIGALFSITGPASFIGEPERNAAEMMVEDVNKKGGINGSPVELFVYYTVGDSTKTVTSVKKLIDKDKVHVIVGPSTSGETLAIIPIVEKVGIPMVSCASSAKIVIPVKKWVFKTPPLDVYQVERLYDYFKKINVKKIALLTVNTGFGDSGREALEAKAPESGIEILVNERYGPKDSDMTAQLTRIAGTKAEAIVVWDVNPGPAIIANNRKQMNLQIPLYLNEGISSKKFIELAGDAAEGAKFAGVKSIVAEHLPEHDAQRKHIFNFTQAFIQKYGQGKFSTFAGTGSDAMMLAFEGLRRGSTNPAKIRDSVENVKNLVGFHGIFNMSPQDHNGLDKKDTIMIQIKNGQFLLLYY
jgi:branched-chain amino acid transport system substrate-binding protein